MSYLGRSAKLSRKTQEKVSFLATAGQTVKTGLSYVSTFVEVRVNGIILTDVLDYTATDGNSITFPVALSLNDEVTVISLKTFALADHYNRAEADAQFSTPADVTTAVSALADSAPAALNTLNELAAALGDDVNFSTTVNNSIATKLPKSGGTMTGPVVLNTNGASNSSKGLEINTSGTNFESDDGIIQVTHAAGGSTTGGYFMKMKAGGADKFTVKGDGTVTASGLAINNAGFTTATITGNSTSETQLRFDGNTAARVSNQANTALIFDTNATEKMRITAGGNVGIGTGAPTQKLDVRGIVHVQPPNTSGVQTGISLHDAGGGSSEGLNIQWSSTSDVNTAYIGSVAYDALRLGTGGSERIRITGSGNVGIGTSSPTEALHISSGGLLIDSYIPNAPASGTSGFIADYAGTNTRLWSRGDATTRGGFEFKSVESDGGNQIDAMYIDSSGKVGIGTSAPALALTTLGDSGYPATTGTTQTGVLRLTGATGLYNVLDMGINESTDTAWIQSTRANNLAASDDLALQPNGGNVLVGKTTKDNGATAGTELQSTGANFLTRSGDTPLYVNRLGSDGTIANFKKDGTVVGSIGSSTSGLYIHSPFGNDSGLVFGSERIVPCTSAGAFDDAAVDLGYGTGRFKDLYLSGGVYLGGTGAANKLDDYEEGTWTPVFACSTTNPTVSNYLTREGSYTKVGDTVTAWCSLRMVINTTGAGIPKVNGLPFATNQSKGGVALGLMSALTKDGIGAAAYNYVQTSSVIFGNALVEVGSGKYCTFTVTYQTT